jgi:hypothetical protein
MQENGLRLLKGAVIIGGVLLIIATIMLFVVLAKKIGNSTDTACSEFPRIELPEDVTLVQTQVEKGLLHLTVMHNPTTYEVLTVNRCSGEITDKIKLETPSAPPPMPFG